MRVPTRRPELILMGRDLDDVEAWSYEGACHLLATLISADPDLADVIRRRAAGRPWDDAVLIAGEVLAQAHRAWRQEGATPEARRAFLRASGLKICSSCGRALPLEAFALDRRSSDGRLFCCRPCRAAHRHRPQQPTKERTMAEYERVRKRR